MLHDVFQVAAKKRAEADPPTAHTHTHTTLPRKTRIWLCYLANLQSQPSAGQVMTAPPLVASGIASHQPTLAGQPQPILPPEYWSQATTVSAPQVGHIQQSLATIASAVAAGQPAPGPEIVYQLDEREVKRQRRKQSNR
jgi:hypothetical protein